MTLSRPFVALFVVLNVALLAACGGSDGGDGGGSAGGGGGGGSGTVASITVTPESLNLSVGTTDALSAIARDATGNVVSGVTFAWESADSAVASVTNGVVAGVAVGSTTVRARVGSVVSNAAAVTVAGGGGGPPTGPVVSITLTPDLLNITVGATGAVSAVPKDAAGNVVGGVTFTWESSDSAVASVANGVVTGVAVGSTTVRARTGSVVSNAAAVSVGPAAVITSITVMPERATVSLGATATLRAIAEDEYGYGVDGLTITWESADGAVASVASGIATGVAVGTTTITARIGSVVSNAVALTVVPPPVAGAVASITITPDLAAVDVGATAALSAVPRDSAGNVVGGVILTWESTDDSVASVANGVVTGVSEGSTTINARAGSVISNDVDLSVTGPPLPSEPPPVVVSITLEPPGVNIEQGTTALFRAVARDAGGNVVDGVTLIWESANGAVASVSDGVATAVAAGSTTITARVGSIFSPAAALTVNLAAASAPRPACGPGTGNWTSLAASVAQVRVWYDASRPADQMQAQEIIAAMDGAIWPTLIATLGFKEPLADMAVACNGGDGRLDIYVVPGLTQRGVTTPAAPAANASEVFIAIKDGLAGDTLRYTVTHHFMHAIEWSYTMAAPQASYGWMRNALANWAVEAVYPGNPVLLADASCLMNSNFLSITSQAAGSCAGDTSRGRDHGAYLLYQYIGRTNGNTKVRELLAATQTMTNALTAIDSLVTGGLRVLWPKFAKTLWNQPPVTDAGRPAYRNWDGNTGEPVLAPDRPTTVNGNRGNLAEASTSLSDVVANVSTRYYRFTFSETATRTLMFHNTFYPLFKAGKKVSVQALWRAAGGPWVEENWTAKEWIGFCRDAKAQRLEELVIIVASGEVGTATQVDAATKPTFKRNNIGCWGYQGTARRTTVSASWDAGSIVVNSTPLYNLQLNLGGTGTQFNDSIRWRVPIAAPIYRTSNWLLAEAYSDGGCSYQLNASGTSTTLTLGGDGFGSIVINNFAESLPAAVRREQFALLGTVRGAYTANAGSQRFDTHTGTITGPQPDCGTSYRSGPGMFMLTNITAGSGPVVRLDGNLFGSFVEGDSTFNWNLHPLSEP